MTKNNFQPVELIKSKNELIDIVQIIIKKLKEYNLQFVYLDGDIGAGKTSLVKEFAKFLKETKEVLSPSFNKMIVYDQFIHIDAYNMENQNLDSFEEYFEDKIVLIEWYKNLKINFEPGIVVEIEYVNDDLRKYKINILN